MSNIKIPTPDPRAITPIEDWTPLKEECPACGEPGEAIDEQGHYQCSDPLCYTKIHEATDHTTWTWIVPQ